MSPDDHNREEERLAAFLASVGSETGPPDEQFLEKLRERSTEVFAAQLSEQAPAAGRRRRMIVTAWRTLAASAAAVAVVAAWLWLTAPSESALALANVLDNLAGADTLHLQMVRDGKTSQLWTKRPGLLRWDEGGGRYKIARGNRLWLVDEAANRATSQPSPYFREDRPGIDVLDLLELAHGQTRENVLAQHPVDRVRRDGLDCDVYRMEVELREGKAQMEALVDAGTARLLSLEARADRDGRPQTVFRMTVIGFNETVPEDLFVVGDTLTEDGRIGKVADAQGIVSLKPAAGKRWTPVDHAVVLKPGDWLRTGARGANAVKVRLVKETEATLGPGSLVELVKPDRIRVFQGELKAVAAAKAPVRLIGPGEQQVAVRGTEMYRIQEEKLVRLAAAPLWLEGFEGTTARESIGSLVANVDGRNVPLSVGYHKVTVDIRDQIARTTIEESFVNHTDSRLEGVFHFPLPQDASISGFGMWIGDELVEADVVERQRAREIYETILREDRDPALLEWSGGSLFKARVFPIPARSEKRVKITYTQVLPLEGSRCRYSYPLQSEMLKQHPLREVAINVNVSSAMPIAAVSSPTHMARVRKTKHSAGVEFSAQQYTPTRDFEVVVEVEGRQSEVVMIPHRRGDDGYFMMLVTPPAPTGDWERDILPDGKPIELLILADTSASIDADGRRAQAEFVASLLSSLTPGDKFNLAACDVQCDWMFEKPLPAETENVEAARRFLADRPSLGWTDLDQAFASALKRCGPQSQVIYVGDGTVTGIDCDPAAFAGRLRRLCEGRPGTFHAVAVGSRIEPLALKTIASLGGGSVRRITGEQGPQTIARQLLSELAKPAVRDLEVQFRGIRVARVYPEQLLNLPAGSQQILLGRYLPEGRDQVGQVIVTGTQGNEPIRFTTPVSLRDAEQGNSFIPRLWARMHLDSLLQEGPSQQVQDEIIALSEEYHIITPYTSLLVLESDADRERFKVKRRFEMRDAEKFFAEGREQADYDLLRQQMKRAGDWRIGLRRRVLGELAKLGRDPEALRSAAEDRGLPSRLLGAYSPATGGAMADFDSLIDLITNTIEPDTWEDIGIPGGVEPFSLHLSLETGGQIEDPLLAAEYGEEGELQISGEPWHVGAPPALLATEVFPTADLQVPYVDHRGMGGFGGMAAFGAGMGGMGAFRQTVNASERWQLGLSVSVPCVIEPSWEYTLWFGELFPGLPATPRTSEPQRVERPWPAAARALADRLLRTEQLAQTDGGLEIDRRREAFDLLSGKLNSRGRTLSLVSPGGWLIRSAGDGAQTTVQWCNRQERGIFSKAFQLGRLRPSMPPDRKAPPLELSGYATKRLDDAYRNYSARLQPQGPGRTLLVLKRHRVPDDEVHVLVDTARNVILHIEDREDGEVTSRTVFDGFVEAAGAWLAGRIERADGKGRRDELITQRFKETSTDALDRRVKEELAGREQVQFFREPLTQVVDAKRALKAGKATFDDHVALLLRFAGSQQWKRVLEHLDSAERLAAGKPGMRWVRNAILNVSRRREELKKRLFDEAARLAKPQAADKVDSEELFLADYLLEQASDFMPAIEMLPLLDRLRAVYERQEPHVGAMGRWLEYQADYLEDAGRPDEALQVRKQLAERYPHDCDAQRHYASALVEVGEHAAAKAWIDRALRVGFAPHDEDRLREVYTDLLESQGRYPELVDYLAERLGQRVGGYRVYDEYLRALVFAGRKDEADALAARWLKEAQVPGKLAPDAACRLTAAIDFAMGDWAGGFSDFVEERWHAPLAEAALFFARRESRLDFADSIMDDYEFAQTDACRRARKTVAEWLVSEIDGLSAEQVERFVDWLTSWHVAEWEVESEVWKQITAGLKRRWETEPDTEVKHALGETLTTILARALEDDEHLAFLRRQLEEGPRRYRADYAGLLFDVLLWQPWSPECEDEAFALLAELSDAKQPAVRLAEQVQALYRLTDAMVQGRFKARMKAIEHPEKLTRTELRARKLENLRLAREGFAERLGRQIARLRKGTGPSSLREDRDSPPVRHSGPLAAWITVERLYLEALLGRDLDAAAAACWEFLGDGPPQPKEIQPEQQAEHRLEEALRDRYLITLMNLAARRGAKPAFVDQVLRYVDQAIEHDPKTIRWKLFKHQLLVALDRPKDLEQALEAWIRAHDPDNRWRVSLGYLLAEQGRIAEAIRLFEAVEAEDELGPDEHRALAGWYMVAGRRQLHGRAMVSVCKTLDEWRLQSWISAKLRPWQQSEAALPTEFDPEVVSAFTAIFEKSSEPEDYLSQLREFYQATHDFRLLACLADGVVGHSAATVYPFLEGMDSVLSEIRDEATADSVIEHLAKVRKRAETDVDQRALDLLEALVERRAAELLNQPGPHAGAALAALQRAFNREWMEGEPPLVADLLGGLGRISQPKLAEEQVRQLQVLHQQEARGSLDRLRIGHSLAQALWSYARLDEAVDLLEAALDEFQDARGGVLPRTANDALSTFVSYLEEQGHHARGERVLLDQLQHPMNRKQAMWLTERLCELYEHAMRNGGAVSLGSGPALYRAVERKIRDGLDTDDQDHRYALIHQLSTLYRTAHERQLPGVVDDLRAFAFQQLPDVLSRQVERYAQSVRIFAELLHELAGPRDGLAFLVERVENEPAWLRFERDDTWSQDGWSIARWRIEAGDLGDLEDRLLAAVTAELRRDLETRQSRDRNIYDCRGDPFSEQLWKEKAEVFARTAEAVLAERRHSGAAVQYIAEYLYHGLNRHGRAIEILFAAHKEGLLDRDGQTRLVELLHERERHGEAIAVLEPMVKRWPEDIEFRVWLMHAYFRTGRREELLDLLDKTDAYFHEDDRWQEDAIARLAKSCFMNELYERSVAYYEELIPLHQRTRPRRGIGEGTLSEYYSYLAQAYAGLGKTAEAVDAACGAVVSWAPRRQQRQQALDSLMQVLGQAPDLDAFVSQLDQESAETETDKPIVRKAIGRVYLERKQYDKAIAQLELARRLQPNDTETHEALVACCDRQGDHEGAVRQMIESIELSRRDIEAYRKLGGRLEALGRPGEAERAYTSIVEVLPGESESHTLLAEIRQEHDRWPEAIAHWKQVARIRSLEPAGLLSLAAAQIHEKQWDEAARTLQELKARSWPPRFEDVDDKIRDLERKIEKGRPTEPHSSKASRSRITWL